MYQHPSALDMNASHYQREALREAANRRLASQIGEGDEASEAGHGHATSPFHRRMVAMAVALVTVLGVVALI